MNDDRPRLQPVTGPRHGERVGAILGVTVGIVLASSAEAQFPVPAIPWAPNSYVCPRAVGSVVVDGRLDEAEWGHAPWTAPFVDIRGPSQPAPRLATRARMQWDDEFFYIAADMVEPHLWSTLTERDAVIYHDNDFEVFIDPDGDTHEYYELEVNTLGTEWDLLLTKPYRDGGAAVDSWDIIGLETGIELRGTINDPTDDDEGWSIELAIPWSVLEEVSHRPTPPLYGDVWNVNFSRVQWRLDEADSGYAKTQSERGGPLPEDNWVWSPQGLVNMHYPEMWGRVQFAADSTVAPSSVTDDERARWAMRRIYYAQRRRGEAGEGWATDIERLDVHDPRIPGYPWPPQIVPTASGYEVVWAGHSDTHILLRDDGRIWFER